MAAGQGLFGRDVTMTVGGQTILGIVSKDFSISNSAVEVTDDQSSGFRELLARGGVRQLDITISGPVKNYALLSTLFATTQMVIVSVDLGDATNSSTLTFDALLTEYSFSGEANDRLEFSASLQSSGVIAFTAGT